VAILQEVLRASTLSRRAAAPRRRIVARDERETGDRALLNLGHTFGHALEAACGFSDRLLHGEAISAGMALAFEYLSARRQGLLPIAEAKRVIGHLGRGRPADAFAGHSGPATSG